MASKNPENALILDRNAARRFARAAVESGNPQLQAISGLNLYARLMGRRSLYIWRMF